MTPIFAALGSAVLAFIEKDVAGNLAKVPPATPPPLLVMFWVPLFDKSRAIGGYVTCLRPSRGPFYLSV